MVCELWTCGAIGRAPGLGDLIDADGLRSAVWRRSDISLPGAFWQITTPCGSLQGAVIVSIQSPVGEPRMKRQLDPDREASEGPIIKAEERPQ